MCLLEEYRPSSAACCTRHRQQPEKSHRKQWGSLLFFELRSAFPECLSPKNASDKKIQRNSRRCQDAENTLQAEMLQNKYYVNQTPQQPQHRALQMSSLKILSFPSHIQSWLSITQTHQTVEEGRDKPTKSSRPQSAEHGKLDLLGHPCFLAQKPSLTTFTSFSVPTIFNPQIQTTWKAEH